MVDKIIVIINVVWDLSNSNAEAVLNGRQYSDNSWKAMVTLSTQERPIKKHLKTVKLLNGLSSREESLS